MTDYYYPKAGGDFGGNVRQKIEIAIGRKSERMMTTSDLTQTLVRFEPPLSEVEKPLVDAIFADPETAADAPTVLVSGNKYVIKDIWEIRAELEAEIGFPVYIWFSKSDKQLSHTDRIEIHFGDKVLSVQDKKKVDDAMAALHIGWK